jgi:hypothetical protein
MHLIDSNIIIYSYSSEHKYLRDLFLSKPCFISEISRVEAMGYPKLSKIEEDCFKDIFYCFDTWSKNLFQNLKDFESIKGLKCLNPII